MLHDEFRLVVVVVIFIEVYGWKYIITGQLKKTLKNLTIILPNSLKRMQIYIAQNKYLCLLRQIIMMHFVNGDKPNTVGHVKHATNLLSISSPNIGRF